MTLFNLVLLRSSCSSL